MRLTLSLGLIVLQASLTLAAVIQKESGPYVVDDCIEVIDNSGCWNSVISRWEGASTNISAIFDCTEGGYKQVNQHCL